MENKRRVLYRKELEWLALAKEYLVKNDFWGYQYNARDAAHDLFFENENLRIEFLEIIPVHELAATRDTLDLLATMSGSDNLNYCGYRQNMKRENVVNNIEMIEQTMKKYLSLHTCYTIFYSWQSDTESKYNRSFIEEAIAKAIKQTNERTNASLSLDENANGVPGSPDIFNAKKQKLIVRSASSQTLHRLVRLAARAFRILM